MNELKLFKKKIISFTPLNNSEQMKLIVHTAEKLFSRFYKKKNLLEFLVAKQSIKLSKKVNSFFDLLYSPEKENKFKIKLTKKFLVWAYDKQSPPNLEDTQIELLIEYLKITHIPYRMKKCLSVIARANLEFTNSLGGNIFQNLDMRFHEKALMHPWAIGQAMTIKHITNPDSEEKIVVYGAFGSDICTVLLATNATKIYAIERKKYDSKKLKRLLNHISRYPENIDSNYLNKRYMLGGIQSAKKCHYNMELGLITELFSLGVNLQNTRLKTEKDHICITFSWNYYLEEPKQRTLNIFHTNMDAPINYPESLKDIFLKKIDIYFQKAANELPEKYDNFISYIGNHIKPGGFTITTDDAQTGSNVISTGTRKTINPDPYLKDFTKVEESNPELNIFKNPIAIPKFFKKDPKTGANIIFVALNYWYDFVLRQKTPINYKSFLHTCRMASDSYKKQEMHWSQFFDNMLKVSKKSKQKEALRQELVKLIRSNCKCLKHI